MIGGSLTPTPSPFPPAAADAKRDSAAVGPEGADGGGGQKVTDTFMEIVRAAPSQA